MRPRFSVLLILLVLLVQSGSARDKYEDAPSKGPVLESDTVIKGKVIDRAGNPVAGANVFLVDAKYGSTTNRNGDYVLTVSASQNGKKTRLRVTHIGYIAQSVPIELAFPVIVRDFQLAADMLVLEATVVTAQKREENLQKVPISISAINARSIQQRGADRLRDLQFDVPNLQIGGSDSFTGIRIRGVGDFSRNIGY